MHGIHFSERRSLSLFTHFSVTDALDYVDGMVGCCGTWKDEMLTDFSAARCVSLASALSFTILNASRFFFCWSSCLVRLNLMWLHVPSVCMSSVFFFFFSNVLPDFSQQPSSVSRMRQHVAEGARDCGPWHKLVSRPFLA